MLHATKAHTRLLSVIALMSLPVIVSAQSYYDDDIYYDPAKDVPKVTKNNKATSYTTKNELVDFPAADTYTFNTGSTRDVDEYNRRGQFLVSDSVANDVADEADTYTNTRRIERFHNSDIIQTLNDDDYATYVYTNPAQVNIYIDGMYSPFYPSYSSYWRWNRWSYYSPWWDLTWGILDPWYWSPSWSWSWGWGPSWAWGPSWGWGPSWAWGPAYGPGHGPGWGPGHGPGLAWSPSPTPAGSSRPHSYVGGGTIGANRNSLRPIANTTSNNRVTGTGTGNGRPGNGGIANSRPGNGGVANTRPGNGGTGVANTTVNNGSADRYNKPAGTSTTNQGYGTTRGRNNSSSTTVTGTTQRQSTNSTPQRSSSSSNTRSSSSSSFNHSSSSSFSGGGMSRGSSGGGGRSSGGGGGGRGRH